MTFTFDKEQGMTGSPYLINGRYTGGVSSVRPKRALTVTVSYGDLVQQRVKRLPAQGGVTVGSEGATIHLRDKPRADGVERNSPTLVSVGKEDFLHLYVPRLARGWIQRSNGEQLDAAAFAAAEDRHMPGSTRQHPVPLNDVTAVHLRLGAFTVDLCFSTATIEDAQEVEATRDTIPDEEDEPAPKADESHEEEPVSSVRASSEPALPRVLMPNPPFARHPFAGFSITQIRRNQKENPAAYLVDKTQIQVGPGTDFLVPGLRRAFTIARAERGRIWVKCMLQTGWSCRMRFPERRPAVIPSLLQLIELKLAQPVITDAYEIEFKPGMMGWITISDHKFILRWTT